MTQPGHIGRLVDDFLATTGKCLPVRVVTEMIKAERVLEYGISLGLTEAEVRASVARHFHYMDNDRTTWWSWEQINQKLRLHAQHKIELRRLEP